MINEVIPGGRLLRRRPGHRGVRRVTVSDTARTHPTQTTYRARPAHAAGLPHPAEDVFDIGHRDTARARRGHHRRGRGRAGLNPCHAITEKVLLRHLLSRG